MFSDVICYPARLLGLVSRWRGFARNMFCSVKFQGQTDHAVAAQFAALPGARLFHSAHNKHELTFALLDGEVTRHDQHNDVEQRFTVDATQQDGGSHTEGDEGQR